MLRDFSIPKDKLIEFCRQNHIRKLSLFGSVLRKDFRPDSDIDILVEFSPGNEPGFIRLAGMERELSELLGNRKVDIRTPQDLSPYFRNQVIDTAEEQYAEQ
ncbi:MAG: nucleotidyltransferase family protein [Deltaproteobacteria bacterium]|nr:nucleotidyltransferase family protein [Deltaproteobacteria bacterium]